MIKNMMQQTKKHLAMFLAAAVVVTSLPVMTADAATVTYKDGDEVLGTASANDMESLSSNAPQVSGNGCKKFTGWTVSGDLTVSDNEVIAIATFEIKHGDTVEVVTEATCTEAGKIEYKCEVCGETVSDNTVIPAKGHGDTVEVVTEATCTEAGKIEYKCEVCEEAVSSNTVIPAKGHGDTVEVVTEATCGKDGKIEYMCEVCGESVSDNTVLPKTGEHTWDEGTVTKEPTTEEEGVKTFTCTVCQETKTESIEKLTTTPDPEKPTTSGNDTPKDPDKKPVEEKPAEEKPVTPTVKLNVKSITLQVKKSTTAVKASGMVKGDKVASWTTSNKKIVTVTKSGKITAKKVGKATITVKTKLGATATLKVTVQKKAVALKKLSVNKTKVTLKKGKTFTIVATKSPITAQDKVTFKSNNKKVATVSSKGVVKAKKAGKATITVKAGKKTKKVAVTVTKK
ncbi:MAG: Ig-like domain-containing protein [Roseburia sp.]|nr:Ig-like domain-containing protein [Roseburia sp.]MCM1277972.1 Ig-like domain-containing protein [Robinsoniella sp.]